MYLTIHDMPKAKNTVGDPGKDKIGDSDSERDGDLSGIDEATIGFPRMFHERLAIPRHRGRYKEGRVLPIREVPDCWDEIREHWTNLLTMPQEKAQSNTRTASPTKSRAEGCPHRIWVCL
jgi:hypothetical protein